jgi:hypothetical protein
MRCYRVPGIRGTPVFLGLSVLVGIDVVVEGDMPSGQWQVRDQDGAIVDGGRLEVL